MRITFLFIFSILLGQLNAQTLKKFWVSFSDKANSEYDINQPEKFLSPRALERRKKQSILVTESDLPVNESYLNEIINKGFTFF